MAITAQREAAGGESREDKRREKMREANSRTDNREETGGRIGKGGEDQRIKRRRRGENISDDMERLAKPSSLSL